MGERPFADSRISRDCHPAFMLLSGRGGVLMIKDVKKARNPLASKLASASRLFDPGVIY